jgi:type IV pilus assembly protein PilY1
MSTRTNPVWQIFRSWCLAALLLGSSLGAGLAQAQALNDVPMAVKNNVAPNFMFMIDNSGSMSNIVPTLPFVETTNYSGACPTGTGILIPAAGSTIDLVISGGVPFARIGGTNRRHTSAIGTGNRRPTPAAT